MPLPRDSRNRDMQLWAITRVQAVTSGTAWTPGSDDDAFAAQAEVGLTITSERLGVQSKITLAVARPIAVIPGDTYTFDASINLEVM